MSRKHFEALATALAAIRPNTGAGERREQWEADVEQVARVCRTMNPRFNAEWFHAAAFGHSTN